MISPRKRLEYLLQDGVNADVLRAQQCRLLLEVLYTGSFVNSVFREGILSIRDALAWQYVITMCKLFDVPRQRDQISVRSVLRYLGRNSDELRIVHRQSVEAGLRRYAGNVPDLSTLPTAQLTKLFVDSADRTLPNPAQLGGSAEAKTLGALKRLRDKSLAHSETTDTAKIFPASWADCDVLLDMVKDLIVAVGGGYLGLDYRGKNSRFVLDERATSVADSVRRLLRAANHAET